MRLITLTIFSLINQLTAQFDNQTVNFDLENLYPNSTLFIKYQQDWQINAYRKRIVVFKKEPIGFNQIVFLGNSITEGGGNWNEKFDLKNIVNRGITGDITGGVLARLDEIFYFKPIAVFLLIGINDIFNGDIPCKKDKTTSYVAKNIINIANQIQINSPNTKIYIQTILPHDKIQFKEVRGFYPEHSIPISDWINEINFNIYKYNLDSEYTIIDLHSAFIDKNGLMIQSLFRDGIHLNDAGYQVWVDYIYKYVESLSNNHRSAD